MTRLIPAVFCLLGVFMTSAFAETVTGTAFYRERIAVPPGATFEAVLEDISLADAAAIELGRVQSDGSSGPPYAFAIEYDPSAIDPAHTYSVRARITGPDGLMFTSDTVHPVLTRGAGQSVELRMVRVAARQQGDAEPVLGAHGLRLPASFSGILPCADCSGVQHHLDLWPDQSYQLRREWLGREDPLVTGAIGRWSVAPDKGTLVLHSPRGSQANDAPLQWQIKGPATLRALAADGSEIVSDLPYELTTDGAFDPVDLPSLPMTGSFVYFADAATFEHCESGQRFGVAMQGGYLDLERAYLAERLAPQAPMLVVIDGQIATLPAMEGPPQRMVVVDRLIDTRPGEDCRRDMATASLVNTYWKLDQLGGAEVQAQPNMREPHIVLRTASLDEAVPRYSATVGCNAMSGSYEVSGTALTFGPGMATLMACMSPLAEMERDLAAALAQTRSYRVTGQTLVLSDSDDAVLAVFRAVYLP